MLASLQSALPVTMNPFNHETTLELVNRFLRNLIWRGKEFLIQIIHRCQFWLKF
jgi:hypothetical protein